MFTLYPEKNDKDMLFISYIKQQIDKYLAFKFQIGFPFCLCEPGLCFLL